MQVTLTVNRRRWTLLWRRRFVFSLPQSWSELSNARKWWHDAIHDTTAARWRLVRSRIPRRWRTYVAPEDMAALYAATAWMEPRSGCEVVPVPSFRWNGVEYVAPEPQGTNMSIAEFVVADEQYKQAAQGDPVALQTLAAILYRPALKDPALAAKRGDRRVPFFHVAEAEARPPLPDDIHAAALFFFSGVKEWVHNVYGPYIFEEPDTDEDGNPIVTQSDTPQFGWWGTLQTVAESGTFGTLEQVYQSNLHDICIYLVRKKSEHDAMLAAMRSNKPTRDNDDA